MNLLRLITIVCVVCAATVIASAQQQQTTAEAGEMQAQQRGVSAQQRALTPDKLLSLGDFYYRNNDISDKADAYYKQVVRNSPGTQAAGYAQYNRGSYWFRKFYVVKEQYSKEDRVALVEAEGQFYDFIDKFAKQTNTIGLLSDAEFNLVLVYLQQGKRDYAVGWLNRMLAEAVKQDPMVYVYKVVWTSKPADIVDRNVDAAQLATFARQAIQKGGDINSVVLDIKRWCQKQ
jgi:tetratricopeptide (TPR) repeat protein